MVSSGSGGSSSKWSELGRENRCSGRRGGGANRGEKCSSWFLRQ